MAIVFNNDGKPTYMFSAGATSSDGTWYAIGGKVDTSAGYEWTGSQLFLNTSTFDYTVYMKDGFNNFLNPGARDAAITSPLHGTICFVRQNSDGSPLNQIQFYNGSAWVANDGDITSITVGAGLTGGGTAGTVSINIDTAVVATTSNTLTINNKTIGSTGLAFEGSADDAFETTLNVINPTADRSINFPDTSGTVITTGNLSSISAVGSLSALTLTGTLTVGSTSGINGQYLKTTGTGLQWQDIPESTASAFLLMGA
jgi:hypothetical protein